MTLKDVWRSAIVRLGAQSVMTYGVQWMLVLPVFNWGTSAQVLFTVIIPIHYKFSIIILYALTIIGATAFSNAFFGQGTGRILLDNLGCIGTETRLVDCPHNGIGIENCVHAEDAGLRCTGKYYCHYRGLFIVFKKL